MSYKINRQKTVLKRKLNKFLCFNCFVLLIFMGYLLCEYYQKNVEENFNQRIVNIRETQKKFLNNQIDGGTTYYISANGTSKIGTTIEQPMSLEYANEKTFYGNDKILFKAGDIFYNSIDFYVDTTNGGMIYIGSYGERK